MSTAHRKSDDETKEATDMKKKKRSKKSRELRMPMLLLEN